MSGRIDQLVFQWDDPWDGWVDSTQHEPLDVTDVRFEEAKEQAQRLFKEWISIFPKSAEEYRVVRRVGRGTEIEEEVFAGDHSD